MPLVPITVNRECGVFCARLSDEKVGVFADLMQLLALIKPPRCSLLTALRRCHMQLGNDPAMVQPLVTLCRPVLSGVPSQILVYPSETTIIDTYRVQCAVKRASGILRCASREQDRTMDVTTPRPTSPLKRHTRNAPTYIEWMTQMRLDPTTPIRIVHQDGSAQWITINPLRMVFVPLIGYQSDDLCQVLRLLDPVRCDMWMPHEGRWRSLSEWRTRHSLLLTPDIQLYAHEDLGIDDDSEDAPVDSLVDWICDETVYPRLATRSTGGRVCKGPLDDVVCMHYDLSR